MSGLRTGPSRARARARRNSAALRFAAAAAVAALAAIGTASTANVAIAERPPTWRLLPDSPIPPARFDDIFFIDASTGWIVNSRGRIYRTTDGGASWQLQLDEPLAYFRDVGFADAHRGWAGVVVGLENLFYSTSDGGETWKPVPNTLDPLTAGICGLSVVDRDVVYGSGAFYGVPRVVKTTDGGASWSSTAMDSHATTLVDCLFWDRDNGIVVGGIGTQGDPYSHRSVVLATTDGGASWETRHVGSRLAEWCWKIDFPSPLVGYVSVESIDQYAVVLKTTDGGATWVEKSLGAIVYDVQGIGFATEHLGWVGGWGGAVFETTNGGDSWAAKYAFANVNRFRFVSPTLGFASGKGIFKYETPPPVLAREKSGALFDQRADDVDRASAGTVVWQSAPNPARGPVSITYSLPAPTRVRLEVFDASGRSLSTLVESERPPGQHALVWDGRNDRGEMAPSGVYFLRLHTGDATLTREIVLLR